MTDLLLRGTVAGLLLGGLAACAMTPAYPTSAPAPAAAAAPAPGPTAAVPPPAPAPEAAPAPAPPPVESQPLPAVTSQPGGASQGASSESAPQPGASAPVTMAPVPDGGRQESRSRVEATRYTATGKVVNAQRMFRDYVVRKGDHLDAIARDLETTRAVLVEANHIKKLDDLRPGQHLKVPVEKAYVAASGDTVAAVAKRFDVSAADLADLNGLSENHRLQTGEQLALPATFTDRGPVALPAAREYAHYTPPTVYRPYASSRYATPTLPPGVRPLGPYPAVATAAPPARPDSQVMAAGKGRFVWPVRGEILSAFGVQDVDKRNDGVDIKSPAGTAVHAAAAGEVVYAGDQVPGFGNLVLVKHADGWVTAYAHLAHVDVKMRESVAQDQQIGEVGETGGVTEPQLHFEVRYAATPIEKARPVNPLLVLPE